MPRVVESVRSVLRQLQWQGRPGVGQPVHHRSQQRPGSSHSLLPNPREHLDDPTSPPGATPGPATIDRPHWQAHTRLVQLQHFPPNWKIRPVVGHFVHTEAIPRLPSRTVNPFLAHNGKPTSSVSSSSGRASGHKPEGSWFESSLMHRNTSQAFLLGRGPLSLPTKKCPHAAG